MAGAGMNQYIITEELLQEAMENTTWGRTNQQKFRDKLTPYQSERDKVLELLTELEWAGLHSDYEDSWGVMTVACPSCFNEKRDGHKESCKLNAILRQAGEP